MDTQAESWTPCALLESGLQGKLPQGLPIVVTWYNLEDGTLLTASWYGKSVPTMAWPPTQSQLRANVWIDGFMLVSRQNQANGLDMVEQSFMCSFGSQLSTVNVII